MTTAKPEKENKTIITDALKSDAPTPPAELIKPGATSDEVSRVALALGFESVTAFADAFGKIQQGHTEWQQQQDVIKRLTSVAEGEIKTQYDDEKKIPVTNMTERPIHVAIGRVENSKEVIPNISVAPLGVAWIPESLFKSHRGLIELVDKKILRVLSDSEVEKQQREHAGVLTGGAEND